MANQGLIMETTGLKKQSSNIDDIVASASSEYGVDPNYIKAIIKSESNFNPKAISSAGAKGLMQIMDATAGDLGVTDPFDPEQSIMGGTKYLAQNLKKYGGDPLKASAAYNAGPGNVDKAIKAHGDKWLENLHKVTGRHADETRQYLKNISKHYPGEIQQPTVRGEFQPTTIREAKQPTTRGLARAGIQRSPEWKRAFGYIDPWKRDVGSLIDKIYSQQKKQDPERTGSLHPIEGLKIFAKGLTKLPRQMLGKSAAAVQGWKGASIVNQDWFDKQYEKAQKQSEEFSRQYGEERIFPGISERDVAQLPENLAFSGLSALAGVGVGLPTAMAPIPGARPAAWAAGTAAAGKAAYNMASYDFMKRYLEVQNEEKLKRTGKTLTLDEETKLKEDFGNLAQKYGLWEALPEAIGQATGLKIIATPLKRMAPVLGENIISRLITKLGALYGTELVTEELTQMGQSNIEYAAGLGGEKREWTDPVAHLKSLREVAPSVFLTTTVMGGAAKAGMMVRDIAAKKYVTDPESRIDATENIRLQRRQAAQEIQDELVEEIEPTLPEGIIPEEPVTEAIPPGTTVTWTDRDGKAIRGVVEKVNKASYTVKGEDGKKYAPRFAKVETVEPTRPEIERGEEYAREIREAEKKVPAPRIAVEEGERVSREDIQFPEAARRAASDEELRREEARVEPEAVIPPEVVPEPAPPVVEEIPEEKPVPPVEPKPEEAKVEPLPEAEVKPEEPKPAPEINKPFIENKVKELGSMEAVEKFYDTDDAVGRYAREYAQKTLPKKKPEEVKPEPKVVPIVEPEVKIEPIKPKTDIVAKADKLHKKSYGLKPKNALQRLLEARQLYKEAGVGDEYENYRENERLIHNYKERLGIEEKKLPEPKPPIEEKPEVVEPKEIIPGATVTWTGKGGKPMRGTVEKVNKASYTVRGEDGKTYAPRMEKVELVEVDLKVEPPVAKEPEIVVPPVAEKGKESTSYLSDNTPIKTQYAVTNANNLITSHTDTLAINKAYPQEMQPRDRERSAMKLQIEEMAKKLNPERLGESASVASGAPIVGDDMVVESGNGRTIAIRKAYGRDIGQKYKEWLTANAEKFGLKKEDIEALDQPVLVRARKTDVDRVDFAKRANQDEVARMSPVEVAKNDAEKLTDADLSTFKPSDEGDITARSNSTFINRFIKQLGPSEAAGFLTEDGRYTKQLIDRIQMAIFHKAYNDDTLLTLIAEEADPDIKTILNALNVAAPHFIQAKAVKGRTGAASEVSSNIIAAAKLIRQSRRTGEPIDTILSQIGMFEQIPEEVHKTTRFLNENIRSAKRMGLVFSESAKAIRRIKMDAQTKALFEDDAEISPSEIIENAIQKVEEQYYGKAQQEIIGFRPGDEPIRKEGEPGRIERAKIKPVAEEPAKPKEVAKEIITQGKTFNVKLFTDDLKEANDFVSKWQVIKTTKAGKEIRVKKAETIQAVKEAYFKKHHPEIEVKPFIGLRKEPKVYAITEVPSLTQINLESIKAHPRFKTAAVTQAEDGKISVKFRNNLGFIINSIEGVDPGSVTLNVGYGRHGLKPGEQVAGFYDHADKSINIVEGVGNRWTIDHEFTHFLEKSGILDTKDMSALNKAIKRKGQSPNEETRAKFIEEAFKTRDAQIRPIQRILQKIADFIDLVINKMGIRTVRGVVRDIETGKIISEVRDEVATEADILYSVKKDTPEIDADPLYGRTDKQKERIGLAKGIPKPKLIDKAKRGFTKAYQAFKRTHKHLDPKTHGDYLNILRIYSNIPTDSRRRASAAIDNFLRILTPKRYDFFTMHIIMGDMIRDIDNGLLADKEELPFGFKDRKDVKSYYDYLNKIAEKDPKIKEALKRRREFNHSLKKELVENKLLSEDVMKYDDYFHHQVMEYQLAKAMGEDYKPGTGTSAKDVRAHRKGWQIARKGSIKDYNTQYVDSEFEVIAQALSQIETKKTLDRIKDLANIVPSLKAEAKAKEIKDWTKLIPEGYTTWKPRPGTAWFKANSITDRMLMEIQEGTSQLKPEDVKQILARGIDETWVIPQELALTMDEFRKFPEDNVLEKASVTMISAWKKWILMNPFRWIKYNINNTSGDSDIILAYEPRIIKNYFPKATKDLWQELKKKKISDELQAEIDQSYKLDVLGSGWSIQEVAEVTSQLSHDKHMSMLLGEKPNLIQKYWRSAVQYTTYRENLLRLAAFRYFKDEIAKGKKPGINLNGVSIRAELQKMAESATSDEMAAKLARELIGDYGNISQAGQWLRAHMIPFWSWQEINAPRYVRLLQNLPHEGKSTKVVSGAMAWKATKLGLKATALYGAVILWNMTFFPDEEKELGEAQRRQLHLILGRREDGSIISLRFQGALSDTLSWFGAEDIVHDISDVAKGIQPIGTKMEEAFKAPVIKIWHGSRPIIKTLGETVLGRTTYPDPFFPRPIRDKWEHIARTFSMNLPYKWIAGKPKRGEDITERLFNDVLSLGFYTSDPGESAYYDVKKASFDFLDKEGIEKPGFIPTTKSNALYYYKQSLKYGDLSAAKRYLEKYKKLGGTLGGIKISIKATHPLASVPKRLRRKFLRSLNKKQRKSYNIALKWYRLHYLKMKRKR